MMERRKGGRVERLGGVGDRWKREEKKEKKGRKGDEVTRKDGEEREKLNQEEEMERWMGRFGGGEHEG